MKSPSFEPSTQCYCRCIRWCLGFRGMWCKNGCDFDAKFVNLVSCAAREFLFLFSKDCLVMVGTYSRLHFGQRGFPLHFILFGRIYIYGGMAPSFDFVVVIGIFCLSHKASKFEQWWPNILEPCDFTSLVGGQRLCLH